MGSEMCIRDSLPRGSHFYVMSDGSLGMGPSEWTWLTEKALEIALWLVGLGVLCFYFCAIMLLTIMLSEFTILERDYATYMLA